jgi:hypothetical protein
MKATQINRAPSLRNRGVLAVLEIKLERGFASANVELQR